jgi:type I restriction enzyme R subunit
MAKQKVGGQARAMVVTGSIMRAIQYFHAFEAYLAERKSPFWAIVAFSGEHEYGGAKVTESTLNGFSSSKIADTIQEDPYRFLICADKFQTGYDEPLLHSMYVDKPLSGIKAVQTLSRLNRAHPKKHDTFVLDFMNDADGIQLSFEPFYRTTILSRETDPNKLHDLRADLDGYQVYDDASIDGLVELYLGGAERDKLEPILEACVAKAGSEQHEHGRQHTAPDRCHPGGARCLRFHAGRPGGLLPRDARGARRVGRGPCPVGRAASRQNLSLRHRRTTEGVPGGSRPLRTRALRR